MLNLLTRKKFGTEGLRGPEPWVECNVSRLCSKIKRKSAEG
jgi:hypothetical protein